jgi:membrane protease YdiL (CAAX protease family)
MVHFAALPWASAGSIIRAAVTTPAERKTQARRGLAIYFSVVIVVSAFLEWKILQTGEFIGKHRWLILMLMYTPTLASVIARAALGEGIRDISFRLGGREGGKALLLAWLFPLWVGLVAYSAAWALGLAQFHAPLPLEAKLYHANAIVNFLAALGLMLTLGSLFSCISAAGEEFGWRGYMLTRLIDAGVPKPLFLSGLIWGLWHTPLILSGQYASGAHPALSALLFVADVIAAGYLAAYVRLRSGSVWPAVLFHGAWNAIIQGAFDRATVDTPLAVGESGYITAAASLLTVAWILRKKWTMFRRPGEPVDAPA